MRVSDWFRLVFGWRARKDAELAANAAAIEALQEKFIGIVSAQQNALASLEKQIADLRAIVANARDEAKPKPFAASSMRQVRSFLAAGDEDAA